MTTSELAMKVKSGEITIEQSLLMAYADGVHEMEKTCLDKARKMSTANIPHTYYRATGTRVIHECAEKLVQERW